MANSETPRKEEHGGLSSARTEFAASLGRRLEAVYAAMAALEQNAISPPRRDNLLRRLHALAASAKILGFAAAAESLTRAEQQLRTGLADTLNDDLTVARNLLAHLPGLVLRGSYSLRPGAVSTPPGTESPSPLAQGPWCVLVCGSTLLADSLSSVGAASSGFELVQATDVARLRELCAMYGPDVVVLDGTLGDMASELRTLRDAAETAGVYWVIAQAAEESVAELKLAGAHTVLTSAISPVTLWRAANRARADDHHLPSAREPIGDVGLRELCERLARELKRGLLEAADEQSQSTVVPLGEGTEIRAAIWAAVARIREIVVAQSESKIHFGPGPDGSVVLAPGAGLGLRGRTLADSASIDLTGRRILVADDDPAVAWFVGGTLRAAGAEVVEAQDGKRALSLVYQWVPELIVSDVLMPGLDGFALCREVKRDVAVRDVPVILLSWKEDLLFRLRELGADADAYIRKEASASSLVERVRELLWPRISLERRLRVGQEVRGRLDGITPRTLLEAACRLGRSLRITLRDASAHYDLRIRSNTLRAVARVRTNGVVLHGQPALASLLGVSAGRFSVVEDDQPLDDDFAEPTLDDVLRTPILRARAAQRVLSGSTLGEVEHLVLDPDTFADELSMLPLSLRPLVDDLLRGTAPRQLLALGAASLPSLEALLSDAARRGAVQTITGKNGEDLLTREILALSTPVSEHPPKVALAGPTQFTFQLTPSPLPEVSSSGRLAPASTAVPAESALRSLDAAVNVQHLPVSSLDDDFDWTAEASWESNLSAPIEADTQGERMSPYSRPRVSAQWGTDKGRTSSGSLLNVDLTTPSAQETPDLSDVVAAVVSDRSAQIGASTSTVLSQQANASEPATTLSPAEQLANLGRQTASQSPHAAPNLGLPSVETAPKINSETTAADEEAVFPLVPSLSPISKPPRASVTAAPVIAVGHLSPHDTLHSELDPATPAPRAAPSSYSPPTNESGTVAQMSDEPAANPVNQQTAPQAIGTEAVSALALGISEDEASPPVARAARDEVPTAGSGTSKAPSEKPGAPRANSWLVPASLALTAGVLSFTVALPIVQRLRSQPVAVADATAAVPTQSTIDPEHPGPASTGSPHIASEPSTVKSQLNAHAEPSAREAAPSVAVPPDKGLLTVKTNGVHSVFVDDEFVGRGPERTVTLSPGQHRVRTSLNGEEHTEVVDVPAAQITQLSIDSNGK